MAIFCDNFPPWYTERIMAENNNREEVKVANRKGLIFKIVGVVIVVGVVLLLILTHKKAPISEAPAQASANDDTALHVVSPVVSGDYTYAFTGIKWIFDTTSPEVSGTNQTWLKMTFADFTRNGQAIAFGNPYKLGVHPGTCKSSDFIDTTAVDGIPFAYATCTDGKTTQDFVVLQRESKIVVMMNEKVGKDPETGWKHWYDLDVTSVVR